MTAAARPRRRASYRRALRSADLRRLLLCNAVSGTGSWSYSVALTVFVFERTHSLVWVSAVALARFVPSMLVSAYGGLLAERFERARLLVVLNAVLALLQVALAVLVLGQGPVVIALGLAALTSMVGTVSNPTVAALIPQVVPEDDLAAANALNGTVDNLVVLAGPSVGALLLLAGGPVLAVLVNALSFVVAGILDLRLHVRSRPTDTSAGGRVHPVAQVLAGFSAIASSSAAATLVAFSVAASFVYGTDTVLFVSISRDLLGTGTVGYGYLLAGLGLGGLVGAAVVNRLAAWPRLGPVILGGLALYLLPDALMVVVHSPGVAFGLQVARGIGTLVVDTLAITSLQRSVSPEMVARVFGAFFAIVLGAITAGALLTPLVLRAGLREALLLYGLGIPLLSLATIPWLVRMDRAAAVTAATLAPRVALLEALALFTASSRSVLERLAASATEQTVSAGIAVVEEGATADAVYVVEAGELEVTAVGESGGPARHLGTLGTGAYFGEIGLLAGIPRTATVSTCAPSRLLRIDGPAFLAALGDAGASSALVTGAAARLSRTHPSLPAPLAEQP